MKKAIVILLIGGIFLTACSTETKEVKCKIGGKDAIFTLKNGIVSSYTFNGAKMGQSVVDEINGEYFTSSKNNEEGVSALNTYVESVNGSCN
ncbi:MAG: hypothetical protein IKE75_05675 [Bacilli bacterium]|nr:hypothetical protein [Bacilli bacterium]